jgi:chromate transporter
MKDYIELVRAFIVIGVSTFGGGYAMFPVLERELIHRLGWVTMDEVMDYYTIAQITPGIIGVNVATFVGYKRKGITGGIAATLGLVLPSVSLMLLAAFFISRFTGYPVVRHAFAGIRIAVGALILETVLKLLKGCYKNIKALVICIAAFALSAVFSFSPVYIVLGAGAAGFFLFPAKRKNPGAGAGEK